MRLEGVGARTRHRLCRPPVGSDHDRPAGGPRPAVIVPDRGTHGELHLDAERLHPLAERLLVRELLDELRPGLQLLRERGDDDAVPERARIRLDGTFDLLRPRREDAVHLRVWLSRGCAKRRNSNEHSYLVHGNPFTRIASLYYSGRHGKCVRMEPLDKIPRTEACQSGVPWGRPFMRPALARSGRRATRIGSCRSSAASAIPGTSRSAFPPSRASARARFHATGCVRAPARAPLLALVAPLPTDFSPDLR